MKYLAYALMLMSLLMTAQAINQQISGIADITTPEKGYTRHIAYREKKPDEYRNLMAYQWFRAILPGAVGLFILRIIRRGEQLDILSHDFQGNGEVDKFSDYLDETKKN